MRPTVVKSVVPSLVLTLVLIGITQQSHLLWRANQAYIELARAAAGERGSWIGVEGKFPRFANWGNIRRGIGQVYFFQYRYLEAIPELELALATNPNDSISALFLGKTLWETGERARAIQVWRQFEAGKYFLAYGKSLARAERWKEALDAFKLVVDIGPVPVDAHFELGRALVLNGQSSEAIPELKLALLYHKAMQTHIFGWDVPMMC